MLDAQRLSMPLVPPRFEVPGPYKPGMKVPLTLSVHNLRAEEEHDVTVHFHADGARIEPSTVRVDSIAAHGRAQVGATAHILPTEEQRDLSAWAQVLLPGREPLDTARVTALILTHPRIVISARCIENETTISVRNDGTAPTVLKLYGVAADLRSVVDSLDRAWRAATDARADGRGELVSDTFELGAEEQTEIRIPVRFASVRAVSIEGERAFTQTSVGASLVPMLKPPSFDVLYAPEGVRNGDVLQWYMPLENPSGRPVHDVQVKLELPASLELLEDSLAIDDVRVLSTDVGVDEHDVTIAVGRLDAVHTTMLRGVFLSHADRNDPNETLPVRGSVSAPSLTKYDIGVDLPIDRRPAFATTQTYLSEMRPAENGAYLVDATITNAESATIERVRIRWELAGVLPLDAKDDRGTPLVLQPGSYRGHPCLITDLATLQPNERRTITLRVEPTLAAEAERTIAVAAALLVDSTPVSLGVSRLEIAAQPDLHSSSLKCASDTLRTGIPRRVQLTIANTGASAAHDVRIAPDIPEGVVLEGLRDSDEGSRWIRLAQMLPPGSSLTTSLLVRLVENPRGDKVVLRATLDASNVSPIDLQPLVLETPSAPLLQQPELSLEPMDHGMLLVRARLANLGDGPATSVILRIPPDDHSDVVNGTTRIDGIPDPVPGLRAAILTGLPIGTLVAGSYREVEWLVSPDASRPYRATLIVDAEDAHGIKLPSLTAQSAPRIPRPFARLATALPEARRLADNEEVRAPERSTTVRATIARDELQSPEESSQLEASAPANALAAGTPAVDDTPTANRENVAASVVQQEQTQTEAFSTNGTIYANGSTAREEHHTEAPVVTNDDAFDGEGREIPPSTELTRTTPGAIAVDEASLELPSLDPDNDARSRNIELLQKIAQRKDAGMLPHVLAARLLVADQIPNLSSDDQDALKEIHDAVAALCSQYRRFSYVGSPDRRWLLQLDAYDAQILPAAARIVESLHPGEAVPPSTVEELDRTITLLHASRVTGRGRATNDRLEAYSVALAEHLQWPENQTPRLDVVLTTEDGQLDSLLADLLEHL